MTLEYHKTDGEEDYSSAIHCPEIIEIPPSSNPREMIREKIKALSENKYCIEESHYDLDGCSIMKFGFSGPICHYRLDVKSTSDRDELKVTFTRLVSLFNNDGDNKSIDGYSCIIKYDDGFIKGLSSTNMCFDEFPTYVNDPVIELMSFIRKLSIDQLHYLPSNPIHSRAADGITSKISSLIEPNDTVNEIITHHELERAMNEFKHPINIDDYSMIMNTIFSACHQDLYQTTHGFQFGEHRQYILTVEIYDSTSSLLCKNESCAVSLSIYEIDWKDVSRYQIGLLFIPFDEAGNISMYIENTQIINHVKDNINEEAYTAIHEDPGAEKLFKTIYYLINTRYGELYHYLNDIMRRIIIQKPSSDN